MEGSRMIIAATGGTVGYGGVAVFNSNGNPGYIDINAEI